MSSLRLSSVSIWGIYQEFFPCNVELEFDLEQRRIDFGGLFKVSLKIRGGDEPNEPNNGNNIYIILIVIPIQMASMYITVLQFSVVLMLN